MILASGKTHFNASIETRKRGSVLIIVLWMAFGLVALALYSGQSMLLEYRASENRLAGIQAEQAINSAVAYVSYVLENLDTNGVLPDLNDYESEEVPVGVSRFWIIGRHTNELYAETPAFGLIGESSKLNINTATREMLEALPGMDSGFAAAIVDWRDSDDEITSGGAESDVYSRKRPAYQCKNAPFESLDELRLVVGATDELLYGEDTNRNGILDPNENDGAASLPSDNQNGRLDTGIIEFLTVHSREPNVQSDGTARINVGDQGSRQELQTTLEEKLGGDRTGEIIQNLGQGEAESLLEFFIRSQMTIEEFAKVADALTVSDDEQIEGRINVNTAPEEVLRCIPGIGEEYAPDLVAYRRAHPDQLNSIAWVTEVLEEPNSIQAGRYLTSRTYQFRADIAAIGARGRGYRRAVCVIDYTEDTPKVVYRRDMSRFGWALGAQLQKELLNREQL